MSDKSMRKQVNDMYFRQYGTTTAAPHEYIIDPPPYQHPEEDVVMGDFLDSRIDDLYTRIQKLEKKKSNGDEIYNDMGILIYKGEMKDGKPHGIGIQYCEDSELILYEGEFKDGYRDGNGTLYWYNGGNFSGGSDGDLNTGEKTLFVGSFKRGLFDGNIKSIRTGTNESRDPVKEFTYENGKKQRIAEGGGFRRKTKKNRSSRKKNSAKKKRNTRRKSRKRSSRRRSKKK